MRSIGMAMLHMSCIPLLTWWQNDIRPLCGAVEQGEGGVKAHAITINVQTFTVERWACSAMMRYYYVSIPYSVTCGVIHGDTSTTGCLRAPPRSTFKCEHMLNLKHAMTQVERRVPNTTNNYVYIARATWEACRSLVVNLFLPRSSLVLAIHYSFRKFRQTRCQAR